MKEQTKFAATITKIMETERECLIRELGAVRSRLTIMENVEISHIIGPDAFTGDILDALAYARRLCGQRIS